jgi:hypothetical protein
MFKLMNQAFLNVDRRDKNLPPKKFKRLGSNEQRTYKIDLLTFIRDNNRAAFIERSHDDLMELILEKLDIKERIAYLARGQVIAYIDLSKLASGDYNVDDDGILTLKTPLTIDCIINPMFVYGKGFGGGTVKFNGYQVIKNTGKATKTKTFSKVQRVKLGCRIKLIKHAIDDQLIPTAIQTAQEKLFTFISLFNGLKLENNDEHEITGVKLVVTSVGSSSKAINPWFVFNQSFLGL